MLEIECVVKVLEVNGEDCDDNVSTMSVVLHIGEKKFTVLGDDTMKAVQNATNT